MVSELRLEFGCSGPGWGCGSIPCSAELLTWHDAGSPALSWGPFRPRFPSCVRTPACWDRPGPAGKQTLLSGPEELFRGNDSGCACGSVLRPDVGLGLVGLRLGCCRGPSLILHPLPCLRSVRELDKVRQQLQEEVRQVSTQLLEERKKRETHEALARRLQKRVLLLTKVRRGRPGHMTVACLGWACSGRQHPRLPGSALR